MRKSLFFTIYTISLLTASKSSFIINAGISSSINDIQKMFKGIMKSFTEIQAFFSGIISFSAKIYSIIGFIGAGTIFLFTFIIIFSAGLNSIGIKKGKSSFFFSLFFADAIWIVWEKSFNPESAQYLISILKANIILITPLVIIILISYIYSFLHQQVKHHYSFSKRILTKDNSVQLSETFQEKSNTVQKLLMRDIINSDTEVTLSKATIKSTKELKELLNKIEEL